MKKDKFLEERFDSYVSGTPSYGATDKAKEQMKSPKKIFWRALVPSVCVLVVLVVVGIVVFNNNQNIATKQSDYELPQDGVLSEENNFVEGYYSDIQLGGSLNAYTQAPKGIEFVKKFSNSSNTAVNEFSYYKNGNSVALVKAEVSAIVSGKRQDVTIYAEYVDETYLLLKDFQKGIERSYKNCSYYQSSGSNNGEPVNNIYLKYKGIKYYISIQSSLNNVADYLDLIIG